MGYTCLAVLLFTQAEPQAEPQALQKELGEMGLKRWASGKNDHRATSLNDIARAVCSPVAVCGGKCSLIDVRAQSRRDVQTGNCALLPASRQKCLSQHGRRRREAGAAKKSQRGVVRVWSGGQTRDRILPKHAGYTTKVALCARSAPGICLSTFSTSIVAAFFE